MGMDVYGVNPINEKGQYFRASVWYWHPLWDCLETLHPVICSKVKEAHYNSGDGLNKKDSLILARLLKKDLEKGVIEKYIQDYYTYIDSLPLEDCKYCNATGLRSWNQENGDSILKVCNLCNGTLKLKSYATLYQINLDLIQEFQQFLQNCGGFKIC